MDYSINSLTSIDSCQKIILETQKEIGNLVHRRDNLQYTQNNASETRARLEQELADATSRLGQLATEIAALPEGSARKKKEIEQSKLVTDKLELEERLSRDDSMTLVEREHELAIVLLKIQEKEIFLASVQARLTALGG